MCAIIAAPLKGYDVLALSSWPTQFLGNSVTKDLIVEAGLTASWFNIKDTIMVNANTDIIKDNKLSVVPGCYASLEKIIYYSSTDLLTYRFGFRFNYAQRKEGVITNFYEGPVNQANLEIRQDIETVRFTPYFRVVLHAEKFLLSTHLGLAIAAKTFDQLRFWEKATNAATGQRLQPYHNAVQGEAGFDFKLKCASVGYFNVGYSLLFGSVKYKKQIFTDPPDQNATQEFNDQLLVSDTQSQYLIKKPVMKLRVSSLYIGFALNF